ncbi:MAG: hypothetical protein KDA91_20300, partial [Planctomycetaceae bacterium]|nr:hypothetical protein [Planctomycetaceae bacterium]
LDGMSLRELASDSDQQSVRAALESMGVYFTRCSDSGTFQLGVHRAKNYTVVAISRHKARPEEGVIDALVDESMKLYFQSSEAIIGRLACSAVRVQRETSDAEDPKIEIQF